VTQYIVRRILLMGPTLIGVSLLVTALLRLLPGDAVDLLVTENAVGGGNATFNLLIDERLTEEGKDQASITYQDRLAAEEEIINEYLLKEGKDPETAGSSDRLSAKNALALEAFKDDIRRKLGVDKNFMEQWSDWVWHAIRGDLGESLVGGVEVRDELQRRIPVSFQLGFFAMMFGTLVAIPVGVISAVKQDSWPDYVSRSIAIAMLALPSFFIATLLIAFSARWAGYSFPIFYKDFWDNPSQNLQLVLAPAIILGFALSGTLMRLTRAQMLEVLRQDYIRTARAKGLVERRVVISHATRNALLPVVTILGLQVPILIGGSLVLEQIFGIPGVAQYLFISILNRDFPALIGVNMMIALVIIVTNLVVDITYGFLDPRVSLS